MHRPLVLASLLWLSSTVLVAQAPVPIGDQFQVNSYTTAPQQNSSLGAFEDGRFVISYESIGSPGTDQDAFSVLAQRFLADATADGSEFQVNTDTTDEQRAADLTTQANGGFTIVWQGTQPVVPMLQFSPKGTTGQEIRGQRFGSDGLPLGAEFQVDSSTSPYQYEPAIDAAPDSSFVVVWDAYLLGDGYQVFGQRFEADGAAVGGEFTVNSAGTGYQFYSDIGIADDNSFIVAWQSDTSSGTDTELFSVQARRFMGDGTPVGNDFQVNTYTSNFQGETRIDAAPDGSFVIAWTSSGSSGGDTEGTSIQGQRYDSAGNVVGGEFQINSITTGYQFLPDIAIAPDGRFAVVWASGPIPPGRSPDSASPRSKRRDRSVRATTKGGGAVPTDIFGQLYSADGAPLGGEFQVNNFPGFFQISPRIAFDGGGDFVVSWDGYSSSGDDDSGNSVQARRFRTTGDVGDRVWVDANRNGIQDPMETGFDGVTVNLYRDGEAMPTDSATTDDGDFFFPQVPAGDWLLEVVTPPGYAFTAQGSGGDATVDSDFDPSTGQTAVFALDSAETDRDLDAGLVLIEADLAILKTVSPNPFLPGAMLVYTLTATNTGPDPSIETTVEDSLPPQVTWVSDTCGAGPPTSGTLIWDVGILAVNGSSTCEVTVQVGAGVTTAFSNTASIFSAVADLNMTNNSSTATSSLATADINLAKSLDAPASPEAGDLITWTLEASNTGPDAATGLMITDVLPAEVLWVSDTCGAGPPTAGAMGETLTWMVGDLAANGMATCDIVTRIVAAGAISNTATATATSFDPDPNNNAGTAQLIAAPSTPEIPTLGTSAMIALTLLLALAATKRLRQN